MEKILSLLAKINFGEVVAAISICRAAIRACKWLWRRYTLGREADDQACRIYSLHKIKKSLDKDKPGF